MLKHLGTAKPVVLKTSACIRVPRRPRETARPTLSFQFGWGLVGASMCCCRWSRSPSTPALSISPSLPHAFSFLDFAKIAFPGQRLRDLPHSSILYLKSFYSKNLAILEFIMSICSGRKISPFGHKFILPGLLRTFQSTLFSRIIHFPCFFPMLLFPGIWHSSVWGS